MQLRRVRLAGLAQRLNALSPLAILGRASPWYRIPMAGGGQRCPGKAGR